MIQKHNESDTPFVTEGQLIRSALGAQWNALSPATQKRFATDPDSPVAYDGIMTEVWCSRFGRFMAVAARMFGSPLVARKGTDVPIDVLVYKKPGNTAICKKRRYHFPDGHHVTVETRMGMTRGGEFIEYAGMGLGMVMSVGARDGKLYFTGKRYVLDLGFIAIPVPAFATPGIATVEHQDHGDDAFRVRIEMRHPWFGTTFLQDGIFRQRQENPLA